MNRAAIEEVRYARQRSRSILLTRFVLAVLLFLSPPDGALAQAVVDPDHGWVAVGRLLRGLGSVKRVMVIGAHPDDEDTALLTWLERGVGADAAYLSLSRGEGGQNLIGPELGVSLGLLRTGELLAARHLDGAEQYFTRAYDFGYSKSAEESFRFWPRDTLLADVVAAVRRFRPQVVVSIFSGTRRDGHGQHQVAGMLAREAFDAAGDSARFPGQLREDLRPWRPLKLYRSTRFDRDATTLTIETGRLDPLYGRSYHQIAMASRSQHRSQDMGRLEALGPRRTSLELIERRVEGATPPTAERSLFDGIDTTLVGLISGLRDPAVTAELARAIRAYGELLAQARATLATELWANDLPANLSAALTRLRMIAGLAERAGAAELLFALEAEERKLESALAEASGVIVDAFADDDLVVPGQTLEVELQVWNGGGRPVEVREGILHTPAGPLELAPGSLSPGSLTRRRVRFTLPEGSEISQPYFLRQPREGAIYTWPPDSPERGLPLGGPVLQAEFVLDIAGERVSRRVEVVHRFADQAWGEVRRPVHVIPAVSVDLDKETSVWALDRSGELELSVRVRNESPAGRRGNVTLELPTDWRLSPERAAFDLGTPGDEAVIDFRVQPPATVTAGSYRVAAVARDARGRAYREGHSLIDYPHIRRIVLVQPAEARIEAFDLNVHSELQVGYVPGAGDAVAAAVAEMGLDVTLLGPQALAAANLAAYDAIVIGIRAYETNPALAMANPRLLAYVRAGGTLITQYQQYGFFEADYAPFPLEARFPHDRVSDETAPVRILRPDHPVFQGPNRIGPDDFKGWVQERGLYFASDWDERYEPLLEMSDPGETPKRGALLVASVGDGIYVYTGLALFRQLPAGVPGAYRVLANLLSLKGGT